MEPVEDLPGAASESVSLADVFAALSSLAGITWRKPLETEQVPQEGGAYAPDFIAEHNGRSLGIQILAGSDPPAFYAQRRAWEKAHEVAISVLREDNLCYLAASVSDTGMFWTRLRWCAPVLSMLR